LSNTSAAFRVDDGCTDTNSNAADFNTGAPSPRYSGSTTKSCDSVTLPGGDANSTVVISQIYSGGGNTGAHYTNDYVQLFNRGTSTVDLTGWSLQYASAAGSTWDSNKQPIGGSIAPGEYYLIQLGAGDATIQALPPANVTGEINMSATSGKIALVKSYDGLIGNCPASDLTQQAVLADFVGYGAADCGEGNKKAPTPGSGNALLRANSGATDTNNNQADFTLGSPTPSRTAPIVELGPAVLGTDPRNNASTAPRDASISINFTETVDVGPGWYSINCTTTGAHNDVTVTGGPKTYLLTPNVSFINGEQCTVTIYKDLVHDRDLDDSGPNADTLLANYTFTFQTSTGTAPAYGPDVHLLMGNPSDAADFDLNNYLMSKPEYALSYNRNKRTPNWVSWHLADEWIGSLTRIDTFRPDPAVPTSWDRALGTDYSGSGFDRGHMVPNADRDKETSIPINQATYLMTNMIPQAPDNNQGPWAAFENYLRTLMPGNELYIVAGPLGVGGTGSSGFATTISNGRITVPASTWKVVLVIPKGENDISRVTAATRTIAIMMPNIQGIRNNDWHQYLTTVNAVEAQTGYDFFANVSDAIENSIEAGTDGVNPPGTEGQSVTTKEDTPKDITLNAVSPNDIPLTYSIVTGPSHGTLVGTGANRTYTPNAGYLGSDSFTFRVNNGQANSNISTVNITVEAKATTTILIDCPPSATYTGAAIEPCTATVTGPGGLNEPVVVSYTDNVTTGTATASAAFAGNTNYRPSSESKTFVINKSSSSTSITCPPSATYTGAAIEPCTAIVTGAGGLNESVTVTYTNNTNAGMATASATYAGDDNHEGSSDSENFQIGKAASTATVNCPSAGQTYTGAAIEPCTASYSGVGGLSGSLTPTYSNNVNAGTATASASYAGDDNHEGSSDSKTFEIGKAVATINVQDYTGVYDGQAHGTTGSATGVNGENLTSLLSLGNSFTNVPGGAANWSFSGNNNYQAASGTANIEITKTTPTFSNLTSAVITYGTATTTLSGKISSGALIPTGSVAITLNGVTQNAAIQPDGTFSSSFATALLPPSSTPYGIAYSYAGDGNFNGASGTGALSVGYGFTALYDQTKVNKSGSTVPIKLQVTDINGTNFSAANLVVTAVGVSLISTDVYGPVESPGNSNPDSNFRFSDNSYIFNLNTTGLASGIYNLYFRVGNDPTLHTVQFRIK
jgi:DNA/RNA endonuclease G (NUC1)